MTSYCCSSRSPTPRVTSSGTLRPIRPGPEPERQPVKTLVEAAAEPWLLDVPRAVRAAGIEVRHAWDVGTLAVDRGIGRARTTVLVALYHALVRLAERNDVPGTC